MEIKDVITGIIIPLFAVCLGVLVTAYVARNENKKNTKIQRDKILNLKSYELKMGIDQFQKNKTYWSRKFNGAKLIMDSPSFNVNDDSKLIELTLEVLRQYDALEIAINAGPQLMNPIVTEIIYQQKGIKNVLNTMGNVFSSHKSNDQIFDESNAYISKIIFDSSELIDVVSRNLLEAVEESTRKNK